MNQIKAAWNDHVSEDSEICLHTWFVGAKIVCFTYGAAALRANIDAVFFLFFFCLYNMGRSLERAVFSVVNVS